MNRDPSLQIDADRADRLLAGAVRDTDPLARLLAAASSPARPDELAGEYAAVMAYRHARRPSGNLVGTANAPARVGAPRGLWARGLTLKAAVLGLAVATAGVALAAGTGVLPTPFLNVDSPTGPTPQLVVTSSEEQRSSAATTVTSTNESTASHEAPSIAPDTSLVGLCRAYEARGDKDPGKSMDSISYARLVAAAGGEENLATYCSLLLTNDVQPSPSSHSVAEARYSLRDTDPGVQQHAGRSQKGPATDLWVVRISGTSPPMRARAGSCGSQAPAPPCVR